nr:hypothetical protein 1573p1_00008 [Serratia marcescens]
MKKAQLNHTLIPHSMLADLRCPHYLPYFIFSKVLSLFFNSQLGSADWKDVMTNIIRPQKKSNIIFILIEFCHLQDASYKHVSMVMQK